MLLGQMKKWQSIEVLLSRDLILCAYHLQKNDAPKIRELVRQKGALKISFAIFMVVTTKEWGSYGYLIQSILLISSLRAWKVTVIIYVQAFVNHSPKSNLPFLSKASLKVQEQVPKSRKCITIIRLNQTLQGKTGAVL